MEASLVHPATAPASLGVLVRALPTAVRARRESGQVFCGISISHAGWNCGDDVIARLKEAEPALRTRGVRHAAVFGSVARGEDRPDSDVDILVEFEPGAEGTIYDYAKLKAYIAGLFDGPVDVIDRASLKPHLRAPTARDAVHAF